MNKNVMSKIAKLSADNAEQVKLEAQKIQLAIVDDVAKETEDMKALVKELNSSVKNAEKLWQKAEALEEKFKEAEKEAQNTGANIEKIENKATKADARAEKTYQKLVKAAEALGLNVMDIKGYKEWDKAQGAMNVAQQDARQYI